MASTPSRNRLASPSNGSFSGLASSVAICCGLRMGSWNWPVCRPLPMIWKDSPIGVTATIWTGSGRTGPRTTVFGLRALFFTSVARDSATVRHLTTFRLGFIMELSLKAQILTPVRSLHRDAYHKRFVFLTCRPRARTQASRSGGRRGSRLSW